MCIRDRLGVFGERIAKFHRHFGFPDLPETVRLWVRGKYLVPKHVAERLHEETEGRLDKRGLRPSLFSSKENKR